MCVCVCARARACVRVRARVCVCSRVGFRFHFLSLILDGTEFITYASLIKEPLREREPYFFCEPFLWFSKLGKAHQNVQWLQKRSYNCSLEISKWVWTLQNRMRAQNRAWLPPIDRQKHEKGLLMCVWFPFLAPSALRIWGKLSLITIGELWSSLN